MEIKFCLKGFIKLKVWEAVDDWLTELKMWSFVSDYLFRFPGYIKKKETSSVSKVF